MAPAPEMAGWIQANLIAYMRLFAGLPGVECADGRVFWLVSGRGAPGDCILRADFDPDGAEAGLDGVLAVLAGLGVNEIGWMVFPGDRPADLGRRLEARGLRAGRGGNWLWADLAALPPAPAVPAGFHIERVESEAMLAEWVRVSEEGFGGSLDLFLPAYAGHGCGAQAFSLHYIGYLDGRPVTSGTLLDAGGGASIYDISTPPALRGQGFGGAITYALMQEIRRRGHRETWIWSSNMAKSLYRSLGYADFDTGMREYVWRRAASGAGG